jgi:hypothetical protein
VNAPGELKNTPLHLACTNHHEDIVAILLMRGASAAARNTFGITPHGRGLHSSTIRLTVSTFCGIRWVHDFPPVY